MLRPRDVALLAALLALWIPCFALFLKERAAGRPAWSPIQVSSAPDDLGFPRYLDTWAWSEETTPDLARGDELLRVGGADLRGAGAIAFFAHALAEADDAARVQMITRRGDRVQTVSLGLRRERYPRRDALVIVSFFGMALLAFLRVPHSRLARTFLLASTAYTLTWTSFQGGPALQNFAYVALRTASGALAAPLLLLTALAFSEEGSARRAVSRWPWCFTILAPSWTSLWFGFPLSHTAGARANLALGLALSVTLLALMARSYRRSGPVGRRRIKWVVYGVFLGLAPVPFALAAAIARPEWWWIWDQSAASLVLIPLFIFIAIVRSNLLDIDRLISASAAYGLILFAALAAVLAGAPRLADVLSAAIGVDVSVAQTTLAIALAAVLVPAQRVVRPWMDRIFHRERVALELGLDALLADLASCEAPEELFARMGDGLDALLRPDACVIYGHAANGYAPVFVRGRAVPPAFEATGKLVAALSGRPRALTRDRWRGRADDGLDPFDRAALDTLGAEVVVPILHGVRLTAFVCLGTKRSGDVYTSTDRVFLSAAAAALARQLDRFDEAEMIRRQQEMQRALRRFVPGAIAARLERGQDLGAAEQEVVVLFVDLRGYTGYADRRPVADVFGTVNRYTEAVTGTVVKHGGSVVEFNGDGMMAVFGAPDRLPAKERAALDAAREIVARVGALDLGEATSIEVGAGLATGPAFVGAIQAADRAIWSAIGSTTNLAARLQALTREFDASIAIDARTFAAVGAAAADFVAHPHTPIRGRTEPEDVYVLPLPPPEHP